MIVPIPRILMPLVEEVMERRCPDCLHLIVDEDRLQLTEDERQRLLNSIVSEFLNELGPSEEPTLRGRQLDDLVSAITRGSEKVSGSEKGSVSG